MWCFSLLWYACQLCHKHLHTRQTFYVLEIMLEPKPKQLKGKLGHSPSSAHRFLFNRFIASLPQEITMVKVYKWLFYRYSVWAESVLKIKQIKAQSLMPCNAANVLSRASTEPWLVTLLENVWARNRRICFCLSWKVLWCIWYHHLWGFI